MNSKRQRFFCILLLALVAGSATLLGPRSVNSQDTRIVGCDPPAGDEWQRRRPEEVGINGVLL